MPPCNFTCNNARVMGELFSKAGLLARFHRDPESTTKAILDLPIEFEFSSAANGAKVGSQSRFREMRRRGGNRVTLGTWGGQQ